MPEIVPEIENSARAALERLQEGDAWCKGNIYDQGRRCLIGAIRNAQSAADDWKHYTEVEDDPIAPLVRNVIESQFPERSANVSPGTANEHSVALFHFNDDPRTTFDDVRVVLEKAAVQVDEILS